MHSAPSNDDLIGSNTKEIIDGDGMTVLNGIVEDFELGLETFTVIWLDVSGCRTAVHGFHTGDEAFAVGEFFVTNFSGKILGHLSGLPGLAFFASIEVPDTFLGSDDQFLLGIVIPVDGMKVVGEMKFLIDD